LTVQGKGEESARSLLPERQVTRERREYPWWPGAEALGAAGAFSEW